MNQKLKKLLPVTVLGLSAACFGLSVTPAQASILVTDWNIEIDNGFCNFTSTGTTVTPSNPGVVPNASYFAQDCNPGSVPPPNGNLGQTISWGTPATPAGQSSITIQSSGPTSLTTNGPFGLVTLLQHNNNPIFGTLNTGTFVGLLDLASVLPADMAMPVFTDSPALFMFDFIETTNAEPCAVPPGGGGPCPDIFVLSSLTTLTNGQIDLTADSPNTFVVTTFQKGSYEYDLLLQVQGVNALTSAQCSAAGAVSNCVGFTTEEGGVNDFTVGAAIRSVRQLPRDVPEPGSLGLLAAGMASLGLLRKSKKAE